MLVKLPHLKPASAANLLQSFTDKFCAIAQSLRKTLSYDQCKEMALYKQLTISTGVAVYFCDPHSPWQRCSYVNTNGLVRQFLPKGTDPTNYSYEQLNAIADQISNSPCKVLRLRSTLAVYRELLLNSSQ